MITANRCLKLFAWILCLSVIFLGACGDDDDDDSGNAADDDDNSNDDDAGDDDTDDDDTTDDDTTDDDTVDDDDDEPTVVSTTPSDGDTEIRLETTVEIVFSESMNTTSVENNLTTVGFSGANTWNPEATSLTITPDNPLAEDETYTIIVQSGALSEAGGALAENAIITFTTVNLWTTTWNGDENLMDRGLDVSIDATGNVYVCGIETTTAQLGDMWFGMWDSDGVEQWTHNYNGFSDHSDAAWGIAVADDGGFILGGSEGLNGSAAYATVLRYDSSHGYFWDVTFNGLNGGYNVTYDVASDGSEYVYGTGFIDVSGQDINIWVGKYNFSDGSEVWFKTFNGTSNSEDIGRAIAADAEENVYVAGYTTVAGEGKNIWLRKYKPDGTIDFTKTYNNDDQNLDDEAYGIAVDAEGNIYLTGAISVDGPADQDIWVRKYDADGNVIWTETVGGSADSQDRGTDVAIGPNGELYVVGWLINTVSSVDIFIRRYDPADGSILWTDMPDFSNSDAANAVVVDAVGNLYVAGEISETGEGINVWLRKYDPDGNWAD